MKAKPAYDIRVMVQKTTCSEGSMYTRYEQDLTPFLEHMRSVQEERTRQRIAAIRQAFEFLLELCRRTRGGERRP